MKDKLVIIVMTTMLILNFLAWSQITIKNDDAIKEIRNTLQQCKVNG